MAPVRRDARVDFRVDDALHLERDGVGPQRIGVVDLEAEAARLFDVIERHAFEVVGAVGIDENRDRLVLDDEVALGPFLLAHQPKLVLEALRSTPRDGEPRTVIVFVLVRENALELGARRFCDRDHRPVSLKVVGSGASGPWSHRSWPMPP